jgi:hypothetical protein
VLLLIDHQPFQFANLHSHEPTLIVNNVVGLAKAAKAFNVPTILTTVTEERGGYRSDPCAVSWLGASDAGPCCWPHRLFLCARGGRHGAGGGGDGESDCPSHRDKSPLSPTLQTSKGPRHCRSRFIFLDWSFFPKDTPDNIVQALQGVVQGSFFRADHRQAEKIWRFASARRYADTWVFENIPGERDGQVGDDDQGERCDDRLVPVGSA